MHSPVLKAALNGAFIEGQTQTYTLDDTTEEVFSLLSQWFYTRKLEGELGGRDKATSNLYKLWVLAEKLLVLTLQNLIIDTIEMLRPKHNTVSTPSAQYIWSNATADSPLRRLFLQQCVWHLKGDVFRSSPDLFPKEMLSELCYLFREITTKQNVPPRNLVDYYVKEN